MDGHIQNITPPPPPKKKGQYKSQMKKPQKYWILLKYC